MIVEGDCANVTGQTRGFAVLTLSGHRCVDAIWVTGFLIECKRKIEEFGHKADANGVVCSVRARKVVPCVIVNRGTERARVRLQGGEPAQWRPQRNVVTGEGELRTQVGASVQTTSSALADPG